MAVLATLVPAATSSRARHRPATRLQRRTQPLAVVDDTLGPGACAASNRSAVSHHAPGSDLRTRVVQLASVSGVVSSWSVTRPTVRVLSALRAVAARDVPPAVRVVLMVRAAAAPSCSLEGTASRIAGGRVS